MNKINMNKTAIAVAKKEAGKVEINIAQIKEVLKVFLIELNKYNTKQIIELVSRYK